MYEHFGTKPVIEIDGQLLGDEFVELLDMTVVEDHLSLPDTFTIRFSDLYRNQEGATPGGSLLEAAGLTIGTEIKISGIPLGANEVELLIIGEVTAIEGAYEAGRGRHIAVRGHDFFHRLHRGRKTEMYNQATDASLVQAVAGEAELTVGTVDDFTYKDPVPRFNQTGAEFLGPKARAHDRELRIVSNGMPQLVFQERAEASEAPEPGGGATDGPPERRKLIFGQNLRSFVPRVTAPQHEKAQARGWDPSQKKMLESNEEPIAGNNAVLSGLGEDAASLAGKFGSATYLQPTPYDDQGEVDALAKTLAAQIGSTYAEAEATIDGMAVRAGEAVSVEGVSKEFVGQWTVGSTRHVFDGQGWRTHLMLTGSQDRTIYGLLSNGAENITLDSGPPINGVVIGVVTDVQDPDKLGRVKVKFPWVSDGDTAYASHWARVVQAGAGADRGTVILPEKDDEVLVAFNMGNPRFPYVLGGLYNGVDKADPGPFEAPDSSGKMNWRGFISGLKHRLIFSDKSGDEYVELSTGDKKYMLKLDQGKTQIEIESGGKITIHGTQDITVKGDTNVKFEATGNLELKGAMVKIESSGVLEAKGSVIKLN
ncbi:MAG TPA: VgrG-related protein [Actinomycetota bacterium]|jgi:phage baseplate assembly protein gpV/phage protein D|nr:VgrG-related protein [Actinomycetota bacterium]